MIKTSDYEIVRAHFEKRLAAEQDKEERKILKDAIFVLNFIIRKRTGDPPHD